MSTNSTAAIATQIDYFQKLLASKYIPAAGVSILYFDYFITLSEEIEYVWMSPFSFVTALFLVTRYLPLMDTATMMAQYYTPKPSQRTCSILWHIEGWSYVVGITVAEAILIVRTYAIWEHKKPIGALLASLLVTFFIVAGYFVQKFVNSVKFIPSPIPSLPGCFAFQADNVIYIVYAVLLANETIVVILTLVRATMTRGIKRSPLFYTIYRDGLIFYLYLLAISIINISILLTQPGEAGSCLAGVHRIMHSIFSARLILNIRKAANHRQAQINTHTALTLPQEETFMELHILPASAVKENAERLDWTE